MFADWDNSGAAVRWYLALTPLVFLPCEVLYYLFNFLSVDWKNAAKEAEIREDCIGYRTEKVQWICRYKAFTEVREAPGALLLYVDPKSFHLIPKKDVGQEQLDQLYRLLKADSSNHRTA